MRRWPVLVLSACYFPFWVVADLPVHCLRSEIAGTWTFFTSQPASSPQKCGHHTPGTVGDALFRLSPTGAVFDGPSFVLNLELPDLVRTLDSSAGADEGLGWWTMVYDQGFEVRISGRAFFAFGSIQRALVGLRTGAAFFSRCNRTAVGWYRQLPDAESPLERFGCYYGVKHGAHGDSPRAVRHAPAEAIEADRLGFDSGAAGERAPRSFEGLRDPVARGSVPRASVRRVCR